MALHLKGDLKEQTWSLDAHKSVGLRAEYPIWLEHKCNGI